MKRALVFLLCLCLTVLSGCSEQIEVNAVKQYKMVDEIAVIGTIYSALPSAKGDQYYVPQSKSDIYIASLVPGSFTGKGKSEVLAVVRVASERLSHAGGLYHAYMAVFDNDTGKLSSEVKHFMADEGDYTTYRGKDLDYVFFAGAVVYQGAAVRDGGLYSVQGGNWEKLWPEDKAFWENSSVGIRDIGLRVMKKKVISGGEQAVPDLVWDFDYYLDWNTESSTFMKRDTEY